MDQPLTTVSAATDQAASHVTDRTSPFGRASATLRSFGAGRLSVLGATALGMLGLFAFLVLRVAPQSWWQLTKYDLMRLAEVAALLVVALMVIMLVARPMIARLLAPAPTGPATAGSGQAALPSAAGRPALAARGEVFIADGKDDDVIY